MVAVPLTTQYDPENRHDYFLLRTDAEQWAKEHGGDVQRIPAPSGWFYSVSTRLDS